ncbi:flagellar type III secretion system protein FlhB [Pseudotabrizicola algicola]|uniref:Flagellar biosynthesis protein FlhB n=1 Tax=Pseudotabrizicola algicola TaxID=2709381 RepID=A0A6B3RK06_9RHOB|nr:flagellar type III secretion system protein FlhB [Pseudotabrizicola algicola]NEX46387.1 flagellar biosynthesis protein FlhB [Pseudotabrizicola algicola]
MSKAEDQAAADKEHEPTEKKLADARKHGDVPKSVELMAAAAYAGLLLAVAIGGQAIQGAAFAGKVLIDQAPEISRLAAASARSFVGGLLYSVLMPLALFLVAPAVAVVLAVVVQRAFVFTPDNLMPMLSRISPSATAKKKFGPEGLVEFAKNFAKLSIVSIALAVLLYGQSDSILATATLDPRQGLVHLIALLGQFLLCIILITAVIGGADLLWQRHLHMQRNRMSRKELMDEMKDSEGDPLNKQKRRQRGQEIAMNQMLVDVATANVVIVNPTHYAVALHWKRGARTAPVVVAKGVDEIARRIRETAAEHGVPVHSDPPTARSIFATVDIGQPVARDHYRAVAAAIRFAEKMRKRSKERVQ